MSFIDTKSLIHGSSLVLATVIGGYFSYFWANKNKIKLKNIEYYLLIAFTTGIIGARLFYFAAYQEQFSSFREILYIWDGGLVSFGGFIFGLLALIVLLFKKKEPILIWLDFLSLGFAVGLIIGRLGDWLSGELNGKIDINNISIPVSFSEAILAILILILTLTFWHKIKTYNGLTFSFILLLYGGGRFFLDFSRPEKVNFISLGQTIDLIIFLIGWGIICFLSRKKRSKNELR